MHQRAFLGSGWARGGVAGSGVVRRAHPASGAQWNVQVVRGKVNGKCLWNACKALSLGLLLMVLGAAMATIGYYADHLSFAQEVRGNHTVRVKNESRGFHLNNLSYAGPIVMGVGGFIVVAACVMTFEARDSAAKVVPARFKMNSTTAPTTAVTPRHHSSYGNSYAAHNSIRHSGSQTGVSPHSHVVCPDRRLVTQSFLQFSRGLVLDSCQNKPNSLRASQGSISKSPSAPDFSLLEQNAEKTSPSTASHRIIHEKPSPKGTRRTFAACALLNPGLLHRHALSVDETAASYRLSHESLQGSGSQGSMALDLHTEYPVTLRVKDRRRPLKRQRRVDEEERQNAQELPESLRRSSHSCSPRLQFLHHRDSTTGHVSGGSVYQLPTHSIHCPSSSSRRRSSNASDCTHRARTRKRDCHHNARGKLERAISSDSRLTGAIPKCHNHHHHHHGQISIDQDATVGSETDIRPVRMLEHNSSVHSH
nr:uncharacterized protein LOC111429247 [Onthophagus taurus]